MKSFNKGFLLALMVVAFGLSACASVMERNVAAEKEAQYHKPVGLDRY